MGAVLNVQLDRIDGIIEAMRRERDTILDGISTCRTSVCDWRRSTAANIDCATNVFLTLPDSSTADQFHQDFSERHCRQDWTAYLHGMGSGTDGRGCCASFDESLQHARQCGVPEDLFQGHVRAIARNTEPDDTRPDPSAAHGAGNAADIIHNIKAATRVALGHVKREEVDVRKVERRGRHQVRSEGGVLVAVRFDRNP